MSTPRFTHINEDFMCEHCQRQVSARKKSCRNHCPFCLTSKHVDINPGDRANPCQGLLKAFGYDVTGSKGLVLLFKCEKCGEETRNVAAHEEAVDPDDYDLILSLKPKLKY